MQRRAGSLAEPADRDCIESYDHKLLVARLLDMGIPVRPRSVISKANAVGAWEHIEADCRVAVVPEPFGEAVPNLQKVLL